MATVCWQKMGQTRSASCLVSLWPNLCHSPTLGPRGVPRMFALAGPVRIRSIVTDAGLEEVSVDPLTAEILLGGGGRSTMPLAPETGSERQHRHPSACLHSEPNGGRRAQDGCTPRIRHLPRYRRACAGDLSGILRLSRQARASPLTKATWFRQPLPVQLDHARAVKQAPRPQLTGRCRRDHGRRRDMQVGEV